MDLGTLFVKCIKYKLVLSDIGRELHLMMAPVSLPPISLVYKFSILFVFIGSKGCFCVFVVDIQFCAYRGQRLFLHFRCWYSMKTRYVVWTTLKCFIVRCLFKFMRSCFVLLEIHSLFQIPLWKASFGGSCFFSIKNPNLRNIQIVFIAANVIFRVSS